VIEEAIREHSLVKANRSVAEQQDALQPMQLEKVQIEECYDSNTSTRREGFDLPLQKQVERFAVKENRAKTNSLHQAVHKKQTSTLVKKALPEPLLIKSKSKKH